MKIVLLVLIMMASLLGDSASAVDSYWVVETDVETTENRSTKHMDGTLTGAGNQYNQLEFIRNMDATRDPADTILYQGSNIRSVSFVGKNSAASPVIGTTHNLTLEDEYWHIDNGTVAPSEHTPFFMKQAVAFTPDTSDFNQWGTDWKFYSGDDVQGMFQGPTLFLNQYYSRGEVSIDHRETYGLGIVTRPKDVGGLPQSASGKTTYPLDQGIVIGGCSGPEAVTGNCRQDSATEGFKVALDIGPEHPTVWGYGKGSKIGTGVHIQNYTDTGLVIGPAHEDAIAPVALSVNGAIVLEGLPSGMTQPTEVDPGELWIDLSNGRCLSVGE